MITPFADLDAVLVELRDRARSILGDTYIGCYLQGSFALAAGDAQSDADFLVVATELPTGAVEASLRRLHAELPSWPGIWPLNVEGSYADATSLRSTAGLGVPWLFVDRGHREMEWDEHCNNLHTRWILRHHGMALDGPPARQLIDEVPEGAMKAAARAALPGVLAGIREWAPSNHAWTQRYIVQTSSRVLYTARTGKVTSKPAALQWARANLDPAWWPLLTQVAEDRALPWKAVDPPRAGSMQQAYDFAAHVVAVAARD